MVILIIQHGANQETFIWPCPGIKTTTTIIPKVAEGETLGGGGCRRLDDDYGDFQALFVAC